MTIKTITDALLQAGIDPGLNDSSGSALRRGWDYWNPVLPPKTNLENIGAEAIRLPATKPDTDGNGMARLPHAHLLRGVALPENSLAVLGLSMDASALRAGIWRQCLIRPVDDTVTEGGNPFLGERGNEICASSRHLMALVGHPPRDLALWLDDLHHRNPSLFRLVLAKDFRGAIAAESAVIDEPWPAVVSDLWEDGERDFLPPFFVAVLYAEIARLSMNHAGLLSLAFDGRAELTSKRLIDRIDTSGGPAASAAVDRAIGLAPYQSLALTPPGEMLESKDVEGIKAWVQTAASSLTIGAGKRGGVDVMPTTPAEARFLRDGFAAHPQYQPEYRKGKGWSFQPRGAACLWGLNWRLNAAVGLLEIAETARAWNRTYRPSEPDLPITKARKSANPVARAIVAIRFRWLAEHDPAAALTLLGETLTKKQKAEERFEMLGPNDVDPLTIDLHLGAKAGLTLLAQAWAAYRQLPGPGEFGYTARSQAHLWLDDVGDDIGHYHGHHSDALRRHDDGLAGNLPLPLRGTPPNVVKLLGLQFGVAARHGDIGHNQPVGPALTYDPQAAYGAQIQGQMVSSLSLDPMHARLKRHKS